MQDALPAEIRQRLAALLGTGGTGNLAIDIKDGRIISLKLTESGRIDRRALSAR